MNTGPHRCWVCYGRGHVERAFYSTRKEGDSEGVPEGRVKCRTCGGTGTSRGGEREPESAREE